MQILSFYVRVNFETSLRPYNLIAICLKSTMWGYEIQTIG